jgi:hypothetical protein
VVTIGTNWIFATLDRDKKILYEDSKTYNIPENLDEVLQILSSIFKAE